MELSFNIGDGQYQLETWSAGQNKSTTYETVCKMYPSDVKNTDNVSQTVKQLNDSNLFYEFMILDGYPSSRIINSMIPGRETQRPTANTSYISKVNLLKKSLSYFLRLFINISSYTC